MSLDCSVQDPYGSAELRYLVSVLCVGDSLGLADGVGFCWGADSVFV